MDELIERLARVLKDTWEAEKDGDIEWSALARNALVELAKMDVGDALPTSAELARVQWKEAYGSDDYSETNATDPDLNERLACYDEQRRMALVGIDLFRAHAAPVIAAQRTRIAELEAAYRNVCNERDIVLARDDAKSLRIAELEAENASLKSSITLRPLPFPDIHVAVGPEAVDAAIDEIETDPVERAKKVAKILREEFGLRAHVGTSYPHTSHRAAWFVAVYEYDLYDDHEHGWYPQTGNGVVWDTDSFFDEWSRMTIREIAASIRAIEITRAAVWHNRNFGGVDG